LLVKGMFVMETKKRKCPRCGFNMVSNYCIKCGYIEGFSDIEANVNPKNNSDDLELVLGDSYQDILHNENSLKCFIMGPIYLCYRNFYLIGTIWFALDIYLRHKISTTDFIFFSKLSLGLIQETPPVVFFWLFQRILFTPFMDLIVLKMAKIKFIFFKKIMPNKYYDFFNKTNKCFYFVFIIYFIIECLLWYYVF